MDEVVSFGAWLRRRRKALDLTQDELAAKIGLAVGTVAKLEADARRPSKDVAARLAVCLQVAEHDRAAFVRFARGESSRQRPAPLPSSAVPTLPTAVPPLHTRGSRPTNLPLQSTPFIGREQEVAAVRERLVRPEVRLLTLTGVGGTGKTRLALQVAADVRDAFPDGVCFVNLASISEPDLVISTVAQNLKIKEVAGQSLLNSLKASLQDKHLLLVLDNFEQVAAAALDVAELLGAAPQIKVLVTSRAPLHLQAEYQYPVPPLALPDPQCLPELSSLSQYEAVALFQQRAQAVAPGFEVTDANAPAVAAICVRLDGLPLAIELAAARSKLLPPAALLKRLDSRFALLRSGARDLPPRHQTLRSTLDWSNALLDPGVQSLFRRLGLFAGGFTLEAATAVCNAANDFPMDIVEGLQTLLDQSLVRTQESANGDPRFTMLETLREYAVERLTRSDEASTVWQHLAGYCLGLAETAASQLDGPQGTMWLGRLAAEYDNLRSVLAALLSGHDCARAARLCAALWQYWNMHGYLTEGRRWLTQTLALGGRLPANLHATVLNAAGVLARNQGDYRAAATLFKDSLNQWRDTGHKAGEAYALLNLGNVALDQGDYTAAQVMYNESLALFQSLEDRHHVPRALDALGDLALQHGDARKARTFYQEGLAVRRNLGRHDQTVGSLIRLGEVARCEGNYALAGALYDEGLVLARNLGHKLYVAMALHNLGHLAYYQADYVRARQLLSESLSLCQELEDQTLTVLCIAGFAEVATSEGQFERAARLLGTVSAALSTGDWRMDVTDRVDYDHAITTTRTQLEEAAFMVAWIQGEAMTLEQATAFALESEAPEDMPIARPPSPAGLSAR